MNQPRTWLFVLATGLIAILGAWGLRARIQAERRTAPATPAKRAEEAPQIRLPTATPTTAGRHRLAGVVTGLRTFVVVESPDGSTALYHRGENVPGLGRVDAVEPNSATFVGPDGAVRLRVAGLPTASPTAPAKPTETTVAAAPTPPTQAPEPPARTTRRSSPEAAPDRSAS